MHTTSENEGDKETAKGLSEGGKDLLSVVALSANCGRRQRWAHLFQGFLHRPPDACPSVLFSTIRFFPWLD
jgi:hypothetical protein